MWGEHYVFGVKTVDMGIWGYGTVMAMSLTLPCMWCTCTQIVDDVLDLTGSSSILGKPALNDIKSGLATAPVSVAVCGYGRMVATCLAHPPFLWAAGCILVLQVPPVYETVGFLQWQCSYMCHAHSAQSHSNCWCSQTLVPVCFGFCTF